MLTLSVPSLDPAFPHPAETRPKALSAWLARLPYASPMETAQQLVTALYALNRRPLDETVRATLLALYRPVVARVGASLETLLAESGVPPGTHTLPATITTVRRRQGAGPTPCGWWPVASTVRGRSPPMPSITRIGVSSRKGAVMADVVCRHLPDCCRGIADDRSLPSYPGHFEGRAALVFD